MFDVDRLQSVARASYKVERLQSIVRASYKLVRQCATRAIGASRGNQVVFVAGVQRSGTNMVMDVLERSPNTKVYHESNPLAFQKFQLRDDETIHRLACSLAPCVVFKALCDSHRLSALLDEFNQSSAIWVFRNYDEVTASHRVSWPKGRNQIDLLVRDRSSVGWRGRGMTLETWKLVKTLYYPEMSQVSANALFWYYRNQLFFDQRLDLDPRVYLLKYEEIATNPMAEVGRLTDFLKLHATRTMSDYIKPSSVRRAVVTDIDPRIRETCDKMLERLDAVWTEQSKRREARATNSSSRLNQI